MQELVKHLTELLAKVECVHNEQTQTGIRLQVQADALAEQDTAQRARVESLNAREAALAPIENLVAYRAAADQQVKAAQEATAALNADRSAFESYRQGETTRLTQLRQVNEQEAERLKTASASMESDIKARVDRIINKMRADLGLTPPA